MDEEVAFLTTTADAISSCKQHISPSGSSCVVFSKNNLTALTLNALLQLLQGRLQDTNPEHTEAALLPAPAFHLDTDWHCSYIWNPRLPYCSEADLHKDQGATGRVDPAGIHTVFFTSDSAEGNGSLSRDRRRCATHVLNYDPPSSVDAFRQQRGTCNRNPSFFFVDIDYAVSVSFFSPLSV